MMAILSGTPRKVVALRTGVCRNLKAVPRLIDPAQPLPSPFQSGFLCGKARPAPERGFLPGSNDLPDDEGGIVDAAIAGVLELPAGNSPESVDRSSAG
jgi:hypothetical protein